MGAPTAGWVKEALPGALAQALAPYMVAGDRNGATLVARIGYLYLGPSDGPGPLGSSQDSIEGTLFVRRPRDGIAAETPLRAISSYYPMAVNQPLYAESNHPRVSALAQAFAGWAPWKLGL